jgi:hypothetical protein
MLSFIGNNGVRFRVTFYLKFESILRFPSSMSWFLPKSQRAFPNA